MRASQLSSQFERGDQSYLRLSLGQFFEQRSEALGCLGSADRRDAVKRVCFNGYSTGGVANFFLLFGQSKEANREF